MWFFKKKNEEINKPISVDEAIRGLTTALDDLSYVQEQKRVEHELHTKQAMEAQNRADIALAEHERAGKIYANISTLLK